MGLPRTNEPGREREFAYLCVDDYIADLVGARALSGAFEFGLIDALLQRQPRAARELESQRMQDPRGLELLLELLHANRVIDRDGLQVQLSRPFMATLQFRDLLEAKLHFAHLVAPDFVDLFAPLLAEPDRFFEQSKVFELFSYQRCFEPSPENYALTERWMRITTALTKYESQACMKYHDFSRYRSLLDVGGNSGEFALRICKRHAGISATVHDLPLVCDIGATHLRAEAEAGRIAFSRARQIDGELPQGFDIVTFKSMLHDWPDAEMRRFLAQAHRSLDSGGTVLIFERGPFMVGERQLPYSMIPFLLFFRSYRAPEQYRKPLQESGFHDIQLDLIQLEMPFILISARK